MSNQLLPGQSLLVNQYLQSNNGKYLFGIWPAGGDKIVRVVSGPPLLPGGFAHTSVLGVFAGPPPEFAGAIPRAQGVSYIMTRDVYTVQMQTDGNLCARILPNQNAWCLMTKDPPNYGIMQDDGNFCVYGGRNPSEQGALKWGSLQHGGKTQALDPMPITEQHTRVSVVADLPGDARVEYSVQWYGGATEYYDTANSLELVGPVGLICWLRLRATMLIGKPPVQFDGPQIHHESGDNFNIGINPNVVYSLNSHSYPVYSWSRES